MTIALGMATALAVAMVLAMDTAMAVVLAIGVWKDKNSDKPPKNVINEVHQFGFKSASV